MDANQALGLQMCQISSANRADDAGGKSPSHWSRALRGQDPSVLILSFGVCQFQSLWCWFFSLQAARRFGVVHCDGCSRQEVAATPAHQQQGMCSVRHDLGLGCRNISQETLILQDDLGEQHLVPR